MTEENLYFTMWFGMASVSDSPISSTARVSGIAAMARLKSFATPAGQIGSQRRTQVRISVIERAAFISDPPKRESVSGITTGASEKLMWLPPPILTAHTSTGRPFAGKASPDFSDRWQ